MRPFGINNSVQVDNVNKDSGKSMEQRHCNMYPSLYNRNSILPKSWDPNDKFNYIGLSQDMVTVYYKGVGKNHKDAASIRTTLPVPKMSSVFYYEVKVVSKGRDGCIGIGFSAKGVNINRLPGWDKYSYGYHGDDGNAFNASAVGRVYGPIYTTGDVIGCILNLARNEILYTKNGNLLGIAFKDINEDVLYPTVGLQTPGEILKANFGQQPFMYDIMAYIYRERKFLTKQIMTFTNKIGSSTTIKKQLIADYLVQEGYYESAELFAKESDVKLRGGVESMKIRRSIQDHILKGDIDTVFEIFHKHFSDILPNNPVLQFELKCRKMLEMINEMNLTEDRAKQDSCKRYPDHAARFVQESTRVMRDTTTGMLLKDFLMDKMPTFSDCDVKDESIFKIHPTNKSFDVDMGGSEDSKDTEFDSNLNPDTDITESEKSDESIILKKRKTNGVINNGLNSDHKNVQPNAHIDSMSTQLKSQLVKWQKIIAFGALLRLDIESIPEQSDKDRLYKYMNNIFSLIAFENPSHSPFAHMLNHTKRQEIACYANRCILAHKDGFGMSSLEALIRQTKVCVDSLVDIQIVESGLVWPHDDIDFY
ncbi:Ran-binding protein 9 [Intoshia linei]|uniref:Ran-binding protein 9 n=1 Tax=Intoshia linei TaxID=1819745 RepID=A0A177ARP6_9BILA|nr:Ran-binding protein 9 [Intoshia linei]